MRAASLHALATAATLLAACNLPKDNEFSAITIDAGMQAGPADADLSKPLLVVSAPNSAVDEGQSIDVTVALNLAITNAVTVSTSVEEGIVADPSILTFLPSENVMTPKKVTIRALPDENTQSSAPKITFKADGYPDATFTINVKDIDKLGIVTNVDALGNKIGVDEDSDNTITVKLSAPPPGDIVVTAEATNPTAISVTASQTLTLANYKDGKAFVIHGTKDANTADEDTTITFKATGMDNRVIAVHVSDKDKQGLKVDPLTLPIVEGTTTGGVINIALQQQPASETTVDIVAPPGITLDDNQLKFSTSNWATTQPVRVTYAADDNTDDSSATVNVKCTALNLTKDVTVNIDDTDVQAIVSTGGAPLPGSLPLDEGDFDTLNVRLKFKPAVNAPVTLSVISTNGSASVDKSSLTFDSNNFSTTKPVKVTATDDTDIANKDAKVRIKSDTIAQVEVDVPVTNKDVQAINVSVTAGQTFSVPENATATFTATLAFNPISDVTVSVDSSNSTSIGVTTPSLVFTAGATGNWATAHNVTLNAPLDSNQVGETADITLRNGTLQKVVRAQVMDTTQPVEYGWSSYFGQSTPLGANTLIAFPIDVTDAATITRLQAIFTTEPGNAKMAIYRDGGNFAGQLVNGSSAFAVTAGGQSGGAVNIPVTPGRYWLAIMTDRQIDLGISSGSGQGQDRRCVRAATDFGSAFPAVFGTVANCNEPQKLANISATGFR